MMNLYVNHFYSKIEYYHKMTASATVQTNMILKRAQNDFLLDNHFLQLHQKNLFALKVYIQLDIIFLIATHIS